jgi:hypothetical protein
MINVAYCATESPCTLSSASIADRMLNQACRTWKLSDPSRNSLTEPTLS